MTWIKTITPEKAENELARLYDLIASARGGIAQIHQAQSFNPRALRAHLEIYKAIVFAPSSLSRIMRERIGVVVSAANNCRYCAAHHSEALQKLGDDAAIIEKLHDGAVPQELPAGELMMLRWASDAALRPSDASPSDIEELKRCGFDDRGILDAALTVAYFSFVNRLVLLLGIELETDYEKTCADMDSTPANSSR